MQKYEKTPKQGSLLQEIFLNSIFIAKKVHGFIKNV